MLIAFAFLHPLRPATAALLPESFIFQALGSGVWAFRGFRVWGLGLGVEGLGLRVSWFRVYGLVAESLRQDALVPKPKALMPCSGCSRSSCSARRQAVQRAS